MREIRWQRFGGYEVSSAGDKRFSAFYAYLEDGRTIEQHYQCDVKGYQPGGRDWKLGKGKPPLDTSFDLYEAYLSLWRRWALRHPDLIEDLSNRVRGIGILSDRFATSPVNQARALAEILSTRSPTKAFRSVQ